MKKFYGEIRPRICSNRECKDNLNDWCKFFEKIENVIEYGRCAFPDAYWGEWMSKEDFLKNIEEKKREKYGKKHLQKIIEKIETRKNKKVFA